MFKATDVEGIFRLSGSAKRIKELQVIFDSPDRYGKGLNWTGYTVHDAANILRRYLNSLPQPIVPLDFYERCRDPLRSHQAQAVGDMEAQGQDIGDFDQAAAIATYQRLITELPPLNRQLLLYILDLLAVFSSKSEYNRMNSANLAAIFQPGLLSHPAHDMKPEEYRLSQDVLIFLIENQDSFLLGMSGTAADEKTVKEVQSGAPSPKTSHSPSTPRASQSALGRSTSNASAGADSFRRYGGVRRNVSVSSKNSTSVPSPISSIPGSPHAGNGSGVGVHRSNTAPSNKSPSLPSSRFNRQADPSLSTSPGLSPGNYLAPTARASSPGARLVQQSLEGRSPSTTSSLTPTVENSSGLTTVEEAVTNDTNKEKLQAAERLVLQPPSQGFAIQASHGTPTRERKVSNIFTKSPTADGERIDTRQPNKLKKKRIPSSSNPSAQSSTQSLQGTPDSPANQVFYTPLPTPAVSTQTTKDPMSIIPPSVFEKNPIPPFTTTPQVGDGTQEGNFTPRQDQQLPIAGSLLKPSDSPTISVHSRTSVTDFSEADHTDEPTTKDKAEKKKRRWRLSTSAKNNGESRTTLSASSQIGSNPIAENSNTSVGSSSKAPKSSTQEFQQPSTELSGFTNLQTSSNDSVPSKEKETLSDRELQPSEGKKGPLRWLKAKVAHAKEERKEREAEKERAKSPPRNGSEQITSLSTVGHDDPQRRRSVDAMTRER